MILARKPADAPNAVARITRAADVAQHNGYPDATVHHDTASGTYVVTTDSTRTPTPTDN